LTHADTHTHTLTHTHSHTHTLTHTLTHTHTHTHTHSHTPPCLPAVELDAVGQLGQLVGQPALLDDLIGADRHLAQRVALWRRQQAELVYCVRHHVLGGGVFADDDVAALLVGLEHADHLVRDVWRGGGSICYYMIR